MTNSEYVTKLCPDADPVLRKKILRRLRKYGENRWWLSESIKAIGYWQLHEPMLLVDFGKFSEGVEALLGRPVWTHEFGLNADGLREEATEAYAGIEHTDEQKKRAIREGVDRLATTGKPIIALEVENK